MIKEVIGEDATKQLGHTIGELLRGGEVIELVGDVGAGKTTFVKGLAKGLAIDEDVQSPSFTISRVYDARDDLRLSHYDFYRLHDAGIMSDELAETMSDPLLITVIEWADLVDGILPSDRLRIVFSAPSEDTRHLEITGPERIVSSL